MIEKNQKHQEDRKSDRLNDPVVLFMGCTLQEIVMVLFMSLITVLVVGVPLPVMIWGRFTLGLAFALILLMPVFLLLLTKLSRLKRGKPAGYYQQYIKMKLSGLGLFKSAYVVRSGLWSTERYFL